MGTIWKQYKQPKAGEKSLFCKYFQFIFLNQNWFSNFTNCAHVFNVNGTENGLSPQEQAITIDRSLPEPVLTDRCPHGI